MRISFPRGRRRELLILLVAVLAFTGIWSFVELADEVREGTTQRFDESIIRSVRQPHDASKPLGPQWLSEVGRDLTALGGIAVLVLVTLAACGYMLLQRLRHAMWLLLAATSGGLLLSTLLKQFFQRDRPSIVPHLSHVMTHSFPSGHSMLSSTVYLTLGALLARTAATRGTKVYVLLVAMLLSFLVGISRVYLGVHYPTDVLAGWSAGTAWALLCWIVADFLQQRGAVEDPEDVSETAIGDKTS